MKKSLIALAALSAVAGAAQAQSSVEMYGIIDMSYSDVKAENSAGRSLKVTSVGNTNSVNGSGVLNGTRLGFRGTEALGSGNKAGFVIEYGVNLTGAESATANTQSANVQLGQGLANLRQGYVSLATNYGTLKAGTQYSFIDATGGEVAGSTAHGGTNASQGAHSLMKYGQQARVSNAVTYATPVFNGFQAKIGINAGEHTRDSNNADVKNGDATEYALEYVKGALKAGYSYQKTKNYTLATGTSVVNLLDTPLDTAAIANTGLSTLTWDVIGVQYDFGFANVGLNNSRFKHNVEATDAADLKSNQTMFSVKVPVTANIALGGAYTDGKLEVGGAKQYSTKGTDLLAFYTFSKRTNAYLGYMETKYDSSTGGTSYKQSQTAVGLRHSF